jgi:hypothetical protein
MIISGELTVDSALGVVLSSLAWALAWEAATNNVAAMPASAAARRRVFVVIINVNSMVNLDLR